MQDEGNSIKNDNISFERVEELKYLGTTLGNEISTLEEIKSIVLYCIVFTFYKSLQKMSKQS